MSRSPSAGARIKAARLQKGLSQTQLAQMLGVSQPAVAHWESGAHAPRFALLPRIAAMLDIPRKDIAPKRTRLTPRLHLNVHTSQVLDFPAAPSLTYEVSRLEISFDEQIEGAAPLRDKALTAAAARRAARTR